MKRLILIAVFILCVLQLTACSNIDDPGIWGEWQLESGDAGIGIHADYDIVTYNFWEFFDNLAITFIFPDGHRETYDTSYSVIGNSKLIISGVETTYKIEGNRLTITDWNGAARTLVRVSAK